MITCCKEKAVLVAVYEEKPKKKTLTSTRNNHINNIKHHHHHHHHYHHHHLQVHEPKRGRGTSRKAELLSYSKHLRESSKLEPSTSDHHRPKPLEAPATNEGQHTTLAVHDPKTKRLKKQPSCLDMNSMFKCFAMSQAKKRMKKRKKRSGDSSSKKTSVVMKTFNARTQNGARRFFKKLMATIQRYR